MKNTGGLRGSTGSTNNSPGTYYELLLICIPDSVNAATGKIILFNRVRMLCFRARTLQEMVGAKSCSEPRNLLSIVTNTPWYVLLLFFQRHRHSICREPQTIGPKCCVLSRSSIFSTHRMHQRRTMIWLSSCSLLLMVLQFCWFYIFLPNLHLDRSLDVDWEHWRSSVCKQHGLERHECGGVLWGALHADRRCGSVRIKDLVVRIGIRTT